MMFLPSFLVFLAVFSVGDAIREAKDEEFPFQVSVKAPDNRHLCGGAFITPKWVLTAASCVKNQRSVRVSYGSADSNNPTNTLESQRIEVQSGPFFGGRNRFALIELHGSIELSKTAKPAGLPTAKAVLQNSTKFSGWKLTQGIDFPPSLYVSDVYYVIPKDCKTATGIPVLLNDDEFCGADEENSLNSFSKGSTVSKAAVVLGVLLEPPQATTQPYIYVKPSEHEEWIRRTLGPDAEQVNWVNEVPNDSAPLHGGVALALVGISAVFVRFI